nr:hypothetical protein [Tanacetum cinerariifolium]
HPFRAINLHSQTHPFLVVSGVGVAVVMETVAVDSGVVRVALWRGSSGVCYGGRRRRGSGGSGDGDGGGGSRVTRWWWRVEESGVGDRVDRSKRSLFGFARKSPPENFSGGGGVVAGGGGVGEKI